MTDAKAARLFVALDLPDAVRTALLRWRAPLLTRPGGDRLRPVPPEALHVTLCFLGETALSDVTPLADAIGEAVGEHRAGGPALALGEALWLPRRAPRVLSVELEDLRGELGRLQGRIAGRLAGGGWFRAESPPYLPHVTVVRVRGREGRARAEPLAAPPALAFDGTAVTLYRSHLGGTGARYEALARVELR